MTASERWLTRKEVAALRGVSDDTVKRDEKRGTYRRVRTLPGDASGKIQIAYGDLVAAGHAPPLDEAEADAPAANTAGAAAGIAGEVVELQLQVARLQAQCEALTEARDHARAEAAELRALLTQAIGVGRAA